MNNLAVLTGGIPPASPPKPPPTSPPAPARPHPNNYILLISEPDDHQKLQSVKIQSVEIRHSIIEIPVHHHHDI